MAAASTRPPVFLCLKEQLNSLCPLMEIDNPLPEHQQDLKGPIGVEPIPPSCSPCRITVPLDPRAMV